MDNRLEALSDRTALMIAPSTPFLPNCVATPPNPPVAFSSDWTAASCRSVPNTGSFVVVVTPSFVTVVERVTWVAA